MAQIDMSKFGKANTSNAAKVDELKQAEQPKTNTQSAELIDNTSEESEGTNETKEPQTESKKDGTVIVRYVGNGIWKDCKGKLWASSNQTKNILSERQYSKEEYETREDIKFMVNYGSMQATYIE